MYTDAILSAIKRHNVAVYLNTDRMHKLTCITGQTFKRNKPSIAKYCKTVERK